MSNVEPLNSFEKIGDAANRVVEKIAPSNVFAPGVYFNLDEDRYHADPALGSSDKKKLLGDPAAYWWDSPLNPAREEKEETPSIIRGRAVHKFVLEGRAAFEASYGRCEHKGTISAGKAEREVMRQAGKTPLAGKDYDRYAMAGTVIRLNPNIAEAFTGGMPEVSVFWEEEVDGEIVRQKARFDYLKVRAISDLKTHDPMDGTSFEASCHRVLKTRAHAIQAQSYLQARSKLAEFVADGAVYGDHDAEWLRKVAASPECAFVFCFWASKGPPLTWGGYFSPGNRKLEEAQVDIDRALQRYVDFRREFGEDCAWIRPAPLTEIDPDNVDNWWLMNAA